MDKADHEEFHCPKRMVLCQLGCGMQLEAGERQMHEENECPLRLVSCPNECGECLTEERLKVSDTFLTLLRFS